MVNNTRKIILGKNNIHIFVFYVTDCYLNPQLVKFYKNSFWYHHLDKYNMDSIFNQLL